jgi:pimeloyl-ACP methyl ester carboxylesterase
MPHVEIGHRLEYEWFGPGPDDAPTIVMLHHGLGSVSAWRDFPEAVGDLPALLDTLRVRRPYLLGQSDGASIAIIYAARGLAPAPVGLMLMAPHVFVEACTVASAGQARVAYETDDLRARLARHHDDPDGAFFGWYLTWVSPDFRSWNIEAEVEKVPCPITVIQGIDDEYGTKLQIESIQARAPASVNTVLLPHCGHSPHRDQPERTLEAIAEHVGDDRGQSRTV